MKVRNQLGILAIAAVVATITGSSANAAFNQGDSVTFNGQPIFSIAQGADGFSADRRAWQAQDALDNALFVSSNPGPNCVSVAHENGAYVLKFDGHYITTADAGSASAQGLTPEALANRWADALRSAVSDSAQTQKYIASLKRPHQLQGDMVAVERRIFAPEGTIMPVAFTEQINAAMLQPGQCVKARVTSNVPLGNYYIPANSILIGNVFQPAPGVYSIRISELQTPNGTVLPINAVLTDKACSVYAKPHPVATIGMPANGATGTRVPATIAVGTGCSTGYAPLTFSREHVIGCGEQANVILEQVSSVAVVPGANAM